MPQLRFHIYTFVGSLAWYFALAYAGMKLGEKWHTDPRFEQAFHRFHLVVELDCGCVGLVCVVALEPRKGSERGMRRVLQAAAQHEDSSPRIELKSSAAKKG